MNRIGSTVGNILIVAFNKAIAEEINVRIRNPRALPAPTAYVQAILNAVMERAYNLVVNAFAGSGKTTAIEHIVRLFPNADARASTLHAFGMNALRYHLRQHGINNIDVQADKIRIIARQLLNYEQLNVDEQQRADLMIAPVHRLCDLARTHTFTSVRPEPTNEDLYALCVRYDVELPDPDTGINESDIFEMVRRVLIASNKNVTMIDFVDMIHLPLLLNVSFWRNDLILVDESQDLDPSQIMMLRRAAGDTCQVVFVGDRFQAIYGFRGADVEAIESVIEMFQAKELPLSTSWRCPVNVIKEAQTIVPQIEAAPNAIEGLVGTLPTHDDMFKLAEAGDFVISRTTAPAVEVCMAFIRHGKAATVRGRDIGRGLEVLVDKIKRRRTSKGKGLVDALVTYREEMLEKLAHPSKESQRQSLQDKLDTLLVLSDDVDTFDNLKNKIRSIFSDESNGGLKDVILCSTAHKAKGLEAERVFIIHPELMPLPYARQAWQKKQEMNLRYVSITRALRELYWVHDGETQKKDKDTPNGEHKAEHQATAKKAPKAKRTAKKATPRKTK